MPTTTTKIIRIDGLIEATSFLSSFPTSLKSRMKNELNTIGEQGVNTMQSNAHVITGRMRGGIKKGPVTEDKLTIQSPVRYSGYENKRGNPHDFFDRSVQTIEQNAKTRIPKLVDSLISSKGK